MSDEKLKPCPFCGGEAAIVPTLDTTVREWFVTCGNLKCNVLACRTKRYYTEAEAIAAWNTRTHGTLTAEQVREAIERHVKFYEGGDYDEQAIADELNATLGGGTCEYKPMWNDDDLITGEYVGMWHTGCGDALTWNYDNDECGKPPAFCPYCGGAVKAVER